MVRLKDIAHEAGVSVRGRTVTEAEVDVEDFEDYLVDWPGETV